MFDINGCTAQLGLIGNPVSHSLSPLIHNFISEKLGNNYVYSAFCVDDVKKALDGVRALGIRGVNVTAPHKVAVMQYLDEISPEAQRQGSVNTIVNNNGILKGYSTDAQGFYRSLVCEGVSVKGKKLLVLGAGGVVSPVLMRLIDEEPQSITVLNRTKEKAYDISCTLEEKTGYLINTSVDALDFDIVINTTSAGMADKKGILPIDSISEIPSLDFIGKNTVVVDMIYNPQKTLFLQECEKRGAKTINGLGMLIYQAVIAYELFTGSNVSEDIIELVKNRIGEQIQ